MRTQARHATGAVRRPPHPLVQQPTIPQRLENPPARLDVVVFQRDVGVVHVHPEADTVRHLLPLAHVAEDALPALLVELFYAVLLNVPLAGQPQLLLDAQLNGKAVGVPAALAQHLVALHRLVPAHHILEDSGQHMMNTGAAVGGRRPVVEHESRRAFPLRSGAPENVALLPVFQNTGIKLRETHTAGNRTEHKATTIRAKVGDENVRPSQPGARPHYNAEARM